MEEQRRFKTELFGFAKDAVLSYVYEQDAAAKQREEQILAENREMLSAIDALKARLKDASAQLEEANSQYEILKAQLYNEKKAAQDKQEAYDRLSREVQQFESAARQRENELQLQNELNKQLQTKLTQQQEEMEALRQRPVIAAPAPEPAFFEEPAAVFKTEPDFFEEPSAVFKTEPAIVEESVTVPKTNREPEFFSPEPLPERSDNDQELSTLRNEIASLKEAFSQRLSGFETLITELTAQKEKLQSKQPSAPQDHFFH